MENLPQKRIGDAVLFSKGVTLSVEFGRNEYVDTPAAMITVAGATFREGEWHYYERNRLDVLYPESAITPLEE